MKGICKYKDPQGYCELSNNVSSKCTEYLREMCGEYE